MLSEKELTSAYNQFPWTTSQKSTPRNVVEAPHSRTPTIIAVGMNGVRVLGQPGKAFLEPRPHLAPVFSVVPASPAFRSLLPFVAIIFSFILVRQSSPRGSSSPSVSSRCAHGGGFPSGSPVVDVSFLPRARPLSAVSPPSPRRPRLRRAPVEKDGTYGIPRAVVATRPSRARYSTFFASTGLSLGLSPSRTLFAGRVNV